MTNPFTWSFHSAGNIVFGCGSVSQVGTFAHKYTARKVLLVTDELLAASGIINKVIESLSEYISEVKVYSESQPEPSLQLVEDCLSFADKVRPDLIIGLGGGSNMDLAKVVALRLTFGGDTHKYLGEDRVPGPIMPVFCIPTTAGSGSEVTGSAVLTDTKNHIKVAMLSNFLRPLLALVDPELSVSCPPKVTSESGIDALVHSIEAYTAVEYNKVSKGNLQQTLFPGRNPMGKLFAAEGIKQAGKYLVRAVNNPNDIEARTGMGFAALMGGLAFSNVCVALVHAMEYPLGGLVKCSHGQGNGILLPYVMKFNAPTRRLEFANIARFLGENIKNLTKEEAAKRAINAVVNLKKEIGIPTTLKDIGVKSDDIPFLSQKAFEIKRLLRFNPRVVRKSDIISIYKEAL